MNPQLGNYLFAATALLSAVGTFLVVFPENTIAHKVGFGLLGLCAAARPVEKLLTSGSTAPNA